MSAVMTSPMPAAGITVPRSALGPTGWTALMAAVLAVLVLIVIFIQKRPQGLFAVKGRSAEA